MNNQLLETLLKIQKKIYKTKDNSILHLLENNKDEIDFIKSKFNIGEVEALFFAAISIVTISDYDFSINIDTISYFLSVNNLEIIINKNSIQNLIDNQFIEEINPDLQKLNSSPITVITILKTKFALHTSTLQHFN